MDSGGVKSLVKGEVQLVTGASKLNFIHEQVRVKVYNDPPETSLNSYPYWQVSTGGEKPHE